jgi:hypothetical protein
MACHQGRARILPAICLLAVLLASPTAQAFDIAYTGATGGNWGDNANWIDPVLGEPLADFAEQAIINTGVIVIVNSPFNTPQTDTGGALLGVTGNTGQITVQNGGNLNIRLSDVQSGQQTPGVLELGRASRGFLVVEPGGTLTAEQILQGGPVATPTVPESKITLGGAAAGTATLTSNGITSLRRTTQINGPNVNFTSKGPVTMSDQHTLIANITSPTTHSPIKAQLTTPATQYTTNATGNAYVNGALQVQFSGVTPALGNAWNVVEATTAIHGNFSSVSLTGGTLPTGGKGLQTRLVNGGLGKQLQVVVEQMLTLELHRQTGVASIRNTSASAGGLNDVSITGYQIASKYGSLTSSGWNSLTDQGNPGWNETTPNANSIGELKSTNGGTAIVGNTSRPLGNIFTQVFPAFGTPVNDDITFNYTTSDGVRQGLINLQGQEVFNNFIVRIDPATGAAQLRNDSPHTIQIEGYSIQSTAAQPNLIPGTWSSLDDQNIHPSIVEAAPTNIALSELITSGSLTLGAFQTYDIGTIFPAASSQAARDAVSFEFLPLNAADASPGVVSFGPLDDDPNFREADFDSDGDVDGADLSAWKAGFGAAPAALKANGDSDADGDVDGSDFLTWQRQLGLPPLAAPAAAAIPEPSTALLAVLACGFFWRRSRRECDEAVGLSTAEATSVSPQRSKDMPQSRTGFHSVVMGLLVLCAVATTQGLANAADILLVTRPAEFGAPDDQLVTLLKSFGHTIVNEGDIPINQADFRAAPPTPAQLQNVDVVLISRANNSGSFDDDAAEIAGWNAITTPIVSMNPQLARGGHATNGNNRWGWVNMEATTTVDNTAAPTDLDPFPNPAHPFVAGRSTDVFFLGETIDYLNRDSSKYPVGSTTVANITIAGAPTAAIVDIPAGSTLFTNGAGVVDPLLGRRVLMQMVEYPDTHDVFRLTTNGGHILNQILNNITTPPTRPSMIAGDVNADGFVNLTDFNIIRTNFGITVDNRNQGDLSGDSFVDLVDARLWKSVAAPADVAVAVIPEPAAIAMAAFGILGVAALRRRNLAA